MHYFYLQDLSVTLSFVFNRKLRNSSVVINIMLQMQSVDFIQQSNVQNNMEKKSEKSNA